MRGMLGKAQVLIKIVKKTRRLVRQAFVADVLETGGGQLFAPLDTITVH